MSEILAIGIVGGLMAMMALFLAGCAKLIE